MRQWRPDPDLSRPSYKSRMTIPTFQNCMQPLLAALVNGDALHRWALVDKVADFFRLTQEERERMLASGKGLIIRSRVGWALTYLKQAGLVSSPKRGLYQLTPRGTDVLAAAPARVDTEYLKRFPEFMEFRSRSRSQTGASDESIPVVLPDEKIEALPPDEALEEAYSRLRGDVEAELLDTVKSGTPLFFERLVIDLLVKMGYGGSREEAARAVGKSGDGGIDGVIDEDRLGLDVIYIQAKRWEG